MAIFGQDIKLDSNNQAAISAAGDLVLTQAAGTGLQDMKLILATPLGSLFYDVNYGSQLHNWIKEENTLATRLALAAEIKTRIAAAPRVSFGSVKTKILSWDDRGITVSAYWKFIEDDNPYNLIISVDHEKQEILIEDVAY